MRHAALICCMMFAAIAGCPGVSENDFGPYPTSAIGGGQLTAGVASFIPGVVPQEGEFSLLVVNTDNTKSYTISVVPLGGLALTRDVSACNVGNFAVPCDAQSIDVQLLVAGAAAPTTLTVTPVPGACTQQIVYIEVAVQQGGTGGTGGTTTPPTLTQTVPASAINCGLGGLAGGGLGT